MTKTKLGIIASVVLGGMVLIGVAAPEEARPDVRVEDAARRDLVATVIGNGQLQPRKKLDLSAEQAGRVIELEVREGSVVKKGDVLLRLDPSRIENAVARAEAQLAQAVASAEQVQTNLLQTQTAKRRAEDIEKSSGLVASSELENARTQAASLEAQYRASGFSVAQSRTSLADVREQLAKTTIVAPMGGLVTRLNVQEGEMATSPLLTIADFSEVEARIIVDETDLPHINVGDSVNLRIDAFPRSRFSGHVTRIANTALRTSAGGGGGQQSNNFHVFVALDHSDVELHSDFSATAEIITERHHGTLSVPILSLVVRDRRGRRLPPSANGGANGGARAAQPGGVEGVFVVEEGIARFRPVRVGIVGDQYAEVLAGLRPGELVVSGTYQFIRELDAGTEVLSSEQRDRVDSIAKARTAAAPAAAAPAVAARP
jgi:HlyD family secretion protein